MTGSRLQNFDVVNEKFKSFVASVKGVRTEKAMTRMAIQAGGYAAPLTPIMTSTLLNSQFREIKLGPSGWVGRFGYGAEYAAQVHNAAGTLKGQGVLRDENRPSFGFVWDPDAQPQFLDIGVALMIAKDSVKIFRDSYT